MRVEEVCIGQIGHMGRCELFAVSKNSTITDSQTPLWFDQYDFYDSCDLFDQYDFYDPCDLYDFYDTFDLYDLYDQYDSLYDSMFIDLFDWFDQ